MKRATKNIYIILFGLGVFWLTSFAYFYSIKSEVGFIEKNDKVIYKNENHKQLYGMHKIKGKTYYFNPKTGYLDSGFRKVKDKTYYFTKKGELYSGQKKLNDKIYYFNTDGSLVQNQFQTIQVNGKKQKSYFDSEGNLVKDKKMEINDIEFSFDKNGKPKFDVKYLKNIVTKIMDVYGGQSSVYFKDLTTGKSFSIREKTYYPCCMIKVPALAAAYQSMEQGKLDYAKNQFYIEQMIKISDNTCYNKLMIEVGNGNGLAGLNAANKICRKAGLKNTELHHSLKPGEGQFNDGGENVSSAKDSGLFFEALYNGEVVSEKSSQEMIELLKLCEDTTHISQGFPYGTMYAHKTGCTSSIYHDGGIVYLPNRDYIIVVYSEDVDNDVGLMLEISKFLYEYELAFSIEV